jgi:hypothetical protein
MTHRSTPCTDEYTAMAEHDGSIMQRLRELQRRRDAGEIDQATFEARYAALDQEVGQPCASCGRKPAAVRRGATALCGLCVLAGAR